MQQPSNKRRKITSCHSILDLPDDTIVNILHCLRPKRKFIGLRALWELGTILNISQSCKRMHSLVTKAYGKEFESLNLTYPNIRFHQYTLEVANSWYPALTSVPFLCNKALREVRLMKLQSTQLLEKFFIGVAKHCPNIQHLTFFDDENLSIYAYAILTKLESLKELAIVEPSIMALSTLSKSFPRLQSLLLFAIRASYLFLITEMFISRSQRMRKWTNYKGLNYLLLILSFNRTELIGDSLQRFANVITSERNNQMNSLRFLGISNGKSGGNLGQFIKVMSRNLAKIPPNLLVEVNLRDNRYQFHRELYRFLRSHFHKSENLVTSETSIFEKGHVFNEDVVGVNEVLSSLKNSRTIFVVNNSSSLHVFIENIGRLPNVKQELAKVTVNRIAWKITLCIDVSETAKNISTILASIKEYRNVELIFESSFQTPQSCIQDLCVCLISSKELESIQIISNLTIEELKLVVDELLLFIPRFKDNLRSIYIQQLGSNEIRSSNTVQTVWVEDFREKITQLEQLFPNLDLDSFRYLFPQFRAAMPE